jgi:hypothetical protein
MAEEKTNQAAEPNGEQDETQTVTAEQFEEIKRQLEETRKAQSGSDRTVAELRKALEQKEQEASNEKKTVQQQAEERIAEIEKKLQQAERDRFTATQKGLAQQLLSEKGIKAPSFIDRLIGDDSEATEAAIKEYIESIEETKLSAADKFARENGRKVTDTGKDSGVGTFDEYTPEQVKRMSTEEFERVFSNSGKK